MYRQCTHEKPKAHSRDTFGAASCNGVPKQPAILSLANGLAKSTF